MAKIILEGTPLDDLPLDEIVRRAAKPAHVIFEGGDRMAFFRNRELLKLFGGAEIFESCEILSTAAIVERLRIMPSAGYSHAFNALRAGELLNWSRQHGLVQQMHDPAGRWKLLIPEMQFELCGPERYQVAVRVRGLTGEAAIAADKIWKREWKRREKARVKRIGLLAVALNRAIDFIAKHAPDTKLPDPLARFAVGEHDTIVAVRELIAGALVPMTVAEADALVGIVEQIYLPILKAVTDRDAEERRIRREEARQREEAELAALAAMFPEPPPPPPPPPLLADIRSTSTSGRGGSTKYEIEGSLEDVQLAIAHIEKWFHPCGYGTGFNAPVEVADGRWLASGSRSNSCD